MKGTIFGCLCLMMAASIWGGMYVVSKHVMASISPFVLLWFRFLIALVILMPFYLRSKETMNGKDMAFMASLGFIGYFVANGSGFIGTYLSTAHMGSLITSAAPAFTVLFAYWILRESLSLKKMTAVMTSTAGVILVIGWEQGSGGETKVLGNIFLIVDALSWGLYCVLVKKVAAKYSALTISTYATGAALLMATPVMVWDFSIEDYLSLQTLSTWLGILYLGIVATAIGFFLWNKGMERMEAGIGSMFYFFTPIVGTALGWLVLGEHLSWSFLAGGVLIFIGTGMVMLNRQLPYDPEINKEWIQVD